MGEKELFVKLQIGGPLWTFPKAISHKVDGGFYFQIGWLLFAIEIVLHDGGVYTYIDR